MNPTLWLQYVMATSVILVFPGPSVLLVTSHGVEHGLPRTLGTIAGDLSANVLQMTAASLGLGLILASSAHLFDWIRWVGIGYLAVMGIRNCILARRRQPVDASTRVSASYRKLFLKGFVVSASNPKAIFFFASFFPLFIDRELPTLPQVFTLMLTFVTLDGTTLLVYTKGGVLVRRWLSKRENAVLTKQLSGGLYLVAAVLLAWAHHPLRR